MMDPAEKTFQKLVAQLDCALAIHLVPNTATELAELFGGETGDEVDKFDRAKRIDPGHEA